MSKTDKTRPWWVRVAEIPHVTCVAEHHHEVGECDLPERPGPRSFSPVTRCHWPESSWLWAARDGGCDCRLCTAHYYRLWDRRSERTRVRRILRSGRYDDL